MSRTVRDRGMARDDGAGLRAVDGGCHEDVVVFFSLRGHHASAGHGGEEGAGNQEAHFDFVSERRINEYKRNRGGIWY